MTDFLTLPSPPPEDQRRPVATSMTRAGEILLELVLMACTFGFGWVGWWIIAWADGQTPAKVVLHLHVVDADDGKLASFWRMAIREAAGKAIAGAIGAAGLYYRQLWLIAIVGVYVGVSAVLALRDPRRRTLWDRISKTVVVEGDPPMIVRPPVEEGTSPV